MVSMLGPMDVQKFFVFRREVRKLFCFCFLFAIISIFWCHHLDTSPTSTVHYTCAEKITMYGLENFDQELDCMWLFPSFWLMWKMWVYVMISVSLASRLSVCGKNCHVAIFLDTTNTKLVKLCMVVALVELFPFIPLSVTLIVFRGYCSVKQF